ncbi:Mob1/phocein, partial [Meira miltonrushii]
KRVRRGQKLEEIQPVIEQAPALQQIDSPFQLQEYLALLIRQDPHDVERIVNLPQATISPTDAFAGGKGKGKEVGSMGGDGSEHSSTNGVDAFFGGEEEPHTVDTDVWVYEQLRRIVSDFTTPWLTSLQRECDRKRKPSSCDAMNADDWMYLCASHGEEKQCCAIDYIIHTLDGTTALLNSHRHFPSRTYIPTTSLRHFGSISRRLSRIFVHAHEHHRDVFEACEAETSLYARFLTLVQAYDLVALDSL